MVKETSAIQSSPVKSETRFLAGLTANSIYCSRIGYTCGAATPVKPRNSALVITTGEDGRTRTAEDGQIHSNRKQFEKVNMECFDMKYSFWDGHNPPIPVNDASVHQSGSS